MATFTVRKPREAKPREPKAYKPFKIPSFSVDSLDEADKLIEFFGEAGNDEAVAFIKSKTEKFRA